MAKIINFSDAATIGIHGLIVLAKSKEPLNAIEISDKIKFSKHHVGKVMQRLVKVGLLTSFRGPTGGFRLKKKPEDIRLYDIYTGIEGEIELGECPHDVTICPVDKCIRNEVISKLSHEFVSFLKSETLQDYL